MKIGFVGLGIMGKPMAKNLLKAGYELAVFDLNKEAVAEVAEAMQMGQMCGVEPEKIFEAIRGGLAGSTVMYAKAPMMMDQNFKPGFRIDLHIKDLNNVVDAAKAVDAPHSANSERAGNDENPAQGWRWRMRPQCSAQVLSEADR